MPKFSGRSDRAADRAADRSSDGAVDRAPSRQGGALLSTVDRIVESRYDSAVALVDGIRARPGRPSTDEIVDELVRKYSKELAAVAALSGGAAALPGTGTAAAVLATGADVAFTIGKLAEMVLAIGVAYGHDARSIEERRAWVLAVLSMGKGAVSGVEGLAGRIGAEGGARIVTSITSTQLDSVNSRLAAKMLARLASEQSAARLGRLLPFGIGAGVGAAGNVLIVRSVARTARKFFSVGPSAAPTLGVDPDVIDVEVLDD